MLSWDEFDKEDGEVVAKATNAGHANEANMDRLDSAGGWLHRKPVRSPPTTPLP